MAASRFIVDLKVDLVGILLIKGGTLKSFERIIQ